MAASSERRSLDATPSAARRTAASSQAAGSDSTSVIVNLLWSATMGCLERPSRCYFADGRRPVGADHCVWQHQPMAAAPPRSHPRHISPICEELNLMTLRAQLSL